MDKEISSEGSIEPKLQIFGHQVSGKLPKFTDKSETYIYKVYSEAEGSFYSTINNRCITDSSYVLKKFIPECNGVFTRDELIEQELGLDSVHSQVQQNLCESNQKGTSCAQKEQWIEYIQERSNRIPHEQKFLKMKNLLKGFKHPNIMDLKLGIKRKIKNIKKFTESTTLTHHFRINGLSTLLPKSKNGVPGNMNHQEVFLSKYYCQKIPVQQMDLHLAFFCFDGNSINLSMIRTIVAHLKELILGFKSFRGVHFMSSSLFIAYDAFNPEKITINFIDFDKYESCMGIDESVEKGLQHILGFWIHCLENAETLEEKLLKKEIKFYQEEKSASSMKELKLESQKQPVNQIV